MKVGNTEERLGKEEKEFDAAAAKYFLGPLQSFLDHDIKSLQVRKIEKKSINALRTFLTFEGENMTVIKSLRQTKTSFRLQMSKLHNALIS